MSHKYLRVSLVVEPLHLVLVGIEGRRGLSKFTFYPLTLDMGALITQNIKFLLTLQYKNGPPGKGRPFCVLISGDFWMEVNP